MVNIFAKTVGMNAPQGPNASKGDTTVEVVVVSPEVAPDLTKELRARAQAMIDAKPRAVPVNTVKDATMGDVQRFTEITSEKRAGYNWVSDLLPDSVPDFLTFEATKYTVQVNDH